MKKHSLKKAFSLIELSVVLIIIGVLTIAIAQGGRLVNASKLLKAQGLTKTAPVLSIPGLTLWMETSLNGSLTGASNANVISDEDTISAWNDLSGNGINVSQATSGYQPTYSVSGINNVPALSFDGSNDYLFSTSLAPLYPGDDSFTFIAVWYKIDPSSNNRTVFEQNNNGTLTQGKRAAIVARSSSEYGFNGESNNFHGNSYIGGSPVISAIVLSAPTGEDSTITVDVYTNSNSVSASGTINASTQDAASDIFCVGAKCLSAKTEYWYGTIAEIMVFDRNLNRQEIVSINNYLSKKYNITLS
jgi:prepilin-type N-terminal cleavage/methylation domain-containing protein